LRRAAVVEREAVCVRRRGLLVVEDEEEQAEDILPRAPIEGRIADVAIAADWVADGGNGRERGGIRQGRDGVSRRSPSLIVLDLPGP
jgi:hypothetical protein